MLILNLVEYSGMTEDGRVACRKNGVETLPSKIKHVGMATRLPLADAIRAISEYEAKLKVETPYYVSEYSLLSVSCVDELTDAEIAMARMYLIERLGNWL